MEAKHTPGPWALQFAGTPIKFGANRHVIRGVVPGYADAQRIAEVVELGSMGEANARLIAAAPDLLAALRGWLDRLAVIEQGTAWRDLPESTRSAVNLQKMLTEAAIAKAEGR